MHASRTLFITTALLEAGTGLVLLSGPALAIGLLLGVVEAAPEALFVARLAGAALLAIGVACWLARDDLGSPSGRGVLWAMLVYNIGACAVLAAAGSTLRMVGVALWPAAALHAFLTAWCALSLSRAGDNA